MKVTVKIPNKEYPYLAVWAGKDQHLTMDEISRINKSDIVLISMVEVNENGEQCDKQPYVQYLLGGKEGFITKNEEEYFELPRGYSLELRQ